MSAAMSIEEARSTLDRYAHHVTTMREAVAPVLQNISTYERRMHSLRATIRGNNRTYARFHKPWVSKEDGIEWFSFSNAIKYGVELHGTGWHLRTGARRQTKVLNATFVFGMTLDKQAKQLLHAFEPGAVCERRRGSVYCTDLRTALCICQVLQQPDRIVWTGLTAQNPHVRMHVTHSTDKFRIARKLE